MDTELKKKWVDALRSGKYKQGRFAMRSQDDSMCCLGVLCDVSKKGEWVTGTNDYGKYWSYKYGDEVSYGILPRSFGEDVKIEPAAGNYAVGCLIGMNDSDRNTFAEIADWIEAKL